MAPAFGVARSFACGWRSRSTNGMPSRCRRWPTTSPAGPAPTMMTTVESPDTGAIIASGRAAAGELERERVGLGVLGRLVPSGPVDHGEAESAGGETGQHADGQSVAGAEVL